MICVYKILSPDLQECYVGGTIDFENRKHVHKSSINNTGSKTLFEKYGFDNCKFVVIEQCEEEELKVKEQWWIDHSVGIVNKIRAHGQKDRKADKQEYYKAKKEQFLANCKAYREQNKEAIATKDKTRYQANKEVIAIRQKAYYERKKQEIKT